MTETKQALHNHTLFDGRETGPDIKSMTDPNLHWHEVVGDKTSTDAYGEGHTHEFRGDTTSGPLPFNDNDENDEDDDEESEMSSLHEDDDDDDDKSSNNKIEYKYFGGKVTEFKQEAVNGIPVGIVKGYIASWSLDRGNDRFAKGAFAESLIELRAKNRPIRLKDHHFRTIGGFPIDRVFEDDRGLFGVGHINLEVQQGREAFSLAKQGILSDFSVGFMPLEFEIDGDIRIITKAEIFEGSIVDEPMNMDANITDVKAVVPFQDLKVADRNKEWDSSAAISRIREFTKSDDNPTAAYKNAFIWFDSKESQQFGSYKLPIADIIGGRMMVVPKAIFSAAAAMQGARGGVDIPDIEQPKAIRHLERYYAKMDIDSPFSDKQYFVVHDVEKWTPRELEKFLKKSGAMSKGAAKIIASRINKIKKDDEKFDKEDEIDYKRIKAALKKGSDPSWNDILTKITSIS